MHFLCRVSLLGVGVVFLQHYRGIVVHPCCKNDTVPGFVTYLSHFLQYIEDISVRICNKNSNLVRKTLSKLEKRSFLAPLRAPHPLVWLRIYVQIHRSGFLRGDIMSHIHRKTLDTPYFLGITAQQEQEVKLFKLKLINNKTNKYWTQVKFNLTVILTLVYTNICNTI